MDPQVQAALGNEPEQLTQVVFPVVVRHPFASCAQVARVFPRQTLPAPAQSDGGVGQEQTALGKAPEHGLPAGQLAVVADTQPLPSTVHVAIVFPARQTLPAPEQSDGAAGQVHMAEGKAPVQLLPLGQGAMARAVRQLFAS